MTNLINHKGYLGLIAFDAEANIFHGEVINIRDVVTFEGTCVEEIKQAFIDSVEDYLEFCAQRGEPPDKPFSGNYALRMSPDIHQQAYIKARQAGVSLNEWINRAIEKQLA